MNRITQGVAYGLAAGALWGSVFMVPVWVPDFTPWQLSAGRYLAYGICSALLLAPRARTLLPQVRRREWLALAWLSLLSNVLYYVLLASAVQLGGVA
jgi:drug/metabolite transporter (DMT)-like permease